MLTIYLEVNPNWEIIWEGVNYKVFFFTASESPVKEKTR